MIAWARAHLRAQKSALRSSYKTPLPTLMTAFVVGISIALPTCLYLLTRNLDGLVISHDDSRQISVFIRHDLDEDAALDVLANVEQRTDVHRVELISKSAALQDLKTMSGVGGMTEMLDQNPLPVTLLIEPAQTLTDAADLSALADELLAMPEVEDIRLDIVWMQRLDAIIELARRAMWLAAVLLGLAVLLTIGNTIRLIVLSQAEEIEVTNRVGGSDSFIRRPFLYRGLLLGLLGAGVALALVAVVRGLIEPRVHKLTEAYGYDYAIRGIGWDAVGIVVAAGCLLGVVAAWFAVRRHLRNLRPSRQFVEM